MIFLYGVFILAVLGMGLGALELIFKHQRELAALRSSKSDDRVAALEHKIDELTQLVYQQTIALDGSPRMSSDRLSERIGV